MSAITHITAGPGISLPITAYFCRRCEVYADFQVLPSCWCCQRDDWLFSARGATSFSSPAGVPRRLGGRPASR